MRFDTVVFAGGGNRCFWQAGFWEGLAPQLEAPPKRILAVSAGAMVACNAMAGLTETFLNNTKATFDENAKNFYWSRWLTGSNPFPHPHIVRSGLERIYTAASLSTLRQSAPVHILSAQLPRRLPRTLALVAAEVGYTVNKFVRKTMHSSWGRRLGFSPHWHSTHESQSAQQLCDMLVASSAIPPAFPAQHMGDVRLVDGGFIDNAPIRFKDVELGHTLVLLTRRYNHIPEHPDRVYVQPSDTVPVTQLDATSGDRIQAAFDLGFEDANRPHVWRCASSRI